MRLEEFSRILREQTDAAVITVPYRTGLHTAAEDNLQMTRAYLQDGDSFLASDDPVNALAAYSYGSGWLHCGMAFGLCSAPSGDCLPEIPVEPLPARKQGRLKEKTDRYARLLALARCAVIPAPEEGTALHTTADRIAAVVSLYAGQGDRYSGEGQNERALACFSYAHGWLDAGVRGGLFSVVSRRDLFTL